VFSIVSLVTGIVKILLLIQLPNNGPNTKKERLKQPVRKANIVPSTLGGVILAKNASIGIKKSDALIYPTTPSDKNMNQKLGIPIKRFHCFV